MLQTMICVSAHAPKDSTSKELTQVVTLRFNHTCMEMAIYLKLVYAHALVSIIILHKYVKLLMTHQNQQILWHNYFASGVEINARLPTGSLKRPGLSMP